MSEKYGKWIRIDHHGPIDAKGGMYGPIVNKYCERDKFAVSQMIMAGIKVIEVLPDNSEVVLTLDNFDQDNYAAKKEQQKKQEVEQKQAQDAARVQTQNQSNKQQNQGNQKQQNQKQQNPPKTEDLQEK